MSNRSFTPRSRLQTGSHGNGLTSRSDGFAKCSWAIVQNITRTHWGATGPRGLPKASENRAAMAAKRNSLSYRPSRRNVESHRFIKQHKEVYGRAPRLSRIDIIHTLCSVDNQVEMHIRY